MLLRLVFWSGSSLMQMALDASVRRQAPNIKNPVAPSVAREIETAAKSGS